MKLLEIGGGDNPVNQNATQMELYYLLSEVRHNRLEVQKNEQNFQ